MTKQKGTSKQSKAQSKSVASKTTPKQSAPAAEAKEPKQEIPAVEETQSQNEIPNDFLSNIPEAIEEKAEEPITENIPIKQDVEENLIPLVEEIEVNEEKPAVEDLPPPPPVEEKQSETNPDHDDVDEIDEEEENHEDAREETENEFKLDEQSQRNADMLARRAARLDERKQKGR